MHTVHKFQFTMTTSGMTGVAKRIITLISMLEKRNKFIVSTWFAKSTMWFISYFHCTESTYNISEICINYFFHNFCFYGMQNVNLVSMHITVSVYWCPSDDGGLILPIRSIEMNSIVWTPGENVFLSNSYFCVLYQLHFVQCLQYVRMFFFILYQK